jgi:hypothetical protein
MTFIKTIALAAGTAALALGVAACHGQSPSSPSYIPTSSTELSAPQGAGAENLGRIRSPIISLCGNVIKIKLLGTVHCKFREKGYNGVFKLFNHVPGLLDLKPIIGDQKTNFLLGGLALGDGFFLVKDLRHHLLLVHVRIVLL